MTKFIVHAQSPFTRSFQNPSGKISTKIPSTPYKYSQKSFINHLSSTLRPLIIPIPPIIPIIPIALSIPIIPITPIPPIVPITLSSPILSSALCPAISLFYQGSRKSHYKKIPENLVRCEIITNFAPAKRKSQALPAILSSRTQQTAEIRKQTILRAQVAEW